MKKANGIKSGMTINVNQDLRALEEGALRSLRKKADALGLRALVERIDQERTQRRVTQGRGLSERESAWLEAVGGSVLPAERIGADERVIPLNGKLVVEIERSQLRPPSREERDRSVRWVFEMTRSEARRLDPLSNPFYALFFAALSEYREREVRGVLFNASGPRNWSALAKLAGRIVRTESSGMFKIEFQ